MSKILEMRQKRAEVWDKARAFLDEHTNESGVMSAEDSQQYERMEQEVVDLGHTIDRMERAEQMDREMNEPVRQPLASRPEKRPGGRTGRASDEYKLAFWNMIRNRGEHFRCATPFRSAPIRRAVFFARMSTSTRWCRR